MAAAAFCALLAGGAFAFKARQNNSAEKERNELKVMKTFDNFSRAAPTVLMADEFSQASLSERSNRTRRGWNVKVEESQPNLSPVTEQHLDPDLSGWNEYFDSSNGSKESDKSSENSQYSVEDFVNEAERNLLGVRIRYPGHNPDGTEAQTRITSTAIVPAPSSSLVPAPSTSIVPAPSNSLVAATPDEIDEASSHDIPL